MKIRMVLLVCAACSSTESPSPKPTAPTEAKPVATKPVEAKPAATLPLPAGWRSEIIKFPLDFAPTIAHRGFEELRFPPGFFDPTKPDYWSYAFTWRTDDAAELDAKTLGSELEVYFRGLIDAVDEKKRITERDKILAKAEADGTKFKITAHVYDAFKTAQPIDLVGWAERKSCASGAVWVFVLAPEKTGIRAQLDELARGVRCE